MAANPDKALERFERRNRATTSTFIAMLIVALLFDGAQAYLDTIPFIGWFLSPIVGIYAWLTFYVWTSLKGWGLSDTLKQFLVNYALPFSELIPIINAIPAWTLKVILTYVFLKAEDKIYNATKGKADAEVLAEAYQRPTRTASRLSIDDAAGRKQSSIQAKKLRRAANEDNHSRLDKAA